MISPDTRQLLREWQRRHDAFIELSSHYVPLGTFPWIGRPSRPMDIQAVSQLDEARALENEAWLKWRQAIIESLGTE